MQRKSAFTLLELLIASALLSTLMLLVWSLFSTYTRLEERSSRAATELQLIRSVSQQLRSDLEHIATFAPPAPNPDEQRTEQSSEREAAGEADMTENNSDANDNAEANGELTPSNEEVASIRIDVSDQAALDPNQSDTRQVFDSRLLETMYFRGSATKLEMVTRLPYTVDVPTGNQLLGAETRYGTQQFVVYEWRGVRDLTSLLRDDPVLNPTKFNPPQPDPLQNPLQNPLQDPLQNPLQNPLQDPLQNPLQDPLQQQQAMQPTRLNPNDNVGLVRESKSWLQVSRDQRRDALMRQAEAAGNSVDSNFPLETSPELQPALERLTENSGQYGDTAGDALQLMWEPPPEFRHKRDHLPEITRLQFRYFDGASWRLDWTDDSRLPYAIEVAFDLDPDAPAVRAKEFEEAHTAMLGGASLNEVLPPEEKLREDETMDLDPLLTTNMLDPTAIVTEYRFVIRMPRGPTPEDRSQEDSTGELSVSMEEVR